MPSVFAWIDHSERQRRQVLDAISLFSEQGTVDELGLGTVRDAIADVLFPGTTSIQTRARYFFFIPWMYQEFERRKVPASDITARGRKAEVELINILVEAEDSFGTIGKQARATLQRLPSSIYWSGLRKLGFLVFQGSREEYHRAFERFHSTGARVLRNDDGEAVGGLAVSWRSKMPTAPAGFPRGATFALTREESEYLRDRIRATHADSLFAFLVNHLDRPTDLVFVWDHPLVSAGQLPEALIHQVTHARRFSAVMHGAALLYNLMLAEQRQERARDIARRSETGTDEERVEQYRSQFGEWAAEVESWRDELVRWDLTAFWTFVRAGNPTRRPFTERFVEAWIGLVRGARPARTLEQSEGARGLIRARERALKHGLARLENPRALELWRGASGTQQLDFRWRNAEQSLNDMAVGLGGGADA